MRRSALISFLGLIVLACSFSISDLLPAPTPGTPLPTGSPTVSSTPSKTPTITPTLPTPTFTDTPTLISSGPTPTASGTPTPTNSLAPLVTQSSATPTGLNVGFASVLISTTHIYWGVCDPSQVTFTAQVTDPATVFNVVLFVRLKDSKSDDTTDWNMGIAMNDKGNGTFTYTLKAKSIDGYSLYSSAWVLYQLVSTDKQNNNMGRTQVYSQSLLLSPCP